MQPDRLFPDIKSTKVGLSFDTGEVPHGEYPSTGINSFADIAPDLATRGAAVRGLEVKFTQLDANTQYKLGDQIVIADGGRATAKVDLTEPLVVSLTPRVTA